tara:strand:- start:746 stop:1036 length:291 start_codon:yes stop_codon:yes gene_type:complete
MLQQSDVKMITFNVPQYLVQNFDELRGFKRLSRTSMLINLMEKFVREEHKSLKDDDKLNHLIMDVKLRNRKPNKPKVEKSGWSRWIKDETKWEDSY